MDDNVVILVNAPALYLKTMIAALSTAERTELIAINSEDLLVRAHKRSLLARSNRPPNMEAAIRQILDPNSSDADRYQPRVVGLRLLGVKNPEEHLIAIMTKWRSSHGRMWVIEMLRERHPDAATQFLKLYPEPA
ncbi:hypothetical protein A3A70_01470 [candidate division WWE3 bacterium RIFCSPLOWO2_01_FULL_42_11]|uniref:Uncharacterized protein n=1 Tax=candidate division WWE3 bacterium RIFCSPLOWO2_01_FULL_42_11 TaxID=1802627 RepID=A0A1F4VQF0_UNCKA|nr:MAG: hypothetical protein A3A70_01470 [candidate division WWE3 bacterium RIFCSPLOWO2_01_FULL_42_11]